MRHVIRLSTLRVQSVNTVCDVGEVYVCPCAKDMCPPCAYAAYEACCGGGGVAAIVVYPLFAFFTLPVPLSAYLAYLAFPVFSVFFLSLRAVPFFLMELFPSCPLFPFPSVFFSFRFPARFP